MEIDEGGRESVWRKATWNEKSAEIGREVKRKGAEGGEWEKEKRREDESVEEQVYLNHASLKGQSEEGVDKGWMNKADGW